MAIAKKHLQMVSKVKGRSNKTSSHAPWFLLPRPKRMAFGRYLAKQVPTGNFFNVAFPVNCLKSEGKIDW